MASEVRVLVAMEPNVYAEVLAFHIRQKRPLSAVVLAPAKTLRAEAERIKPHLTIANEVPPDLKEESFWVEVRVEGELVATIEADGYSQTIHDVTLRELLAVVDKAEERLADDEEA